MKSNLTEKEELFKACCLGLVTGVSLAIVMIHLFGDVIINWMKMLVQ